jgi:predicted enzyme related to lactoylglutathione lyase
VAECTDDQGTRFAVHEYPGGVVPAIAVPAIGMPGTVMPGTGTADTGTAAAAQDGGLAYVTFEVVDSRRARDFYGAVLGWQFVPGRVTDGWQVMGTTPMAGLSGGHAEATAVPVWRVADLRAAVGRVREAGGTATEPQQEPYGLMADCADDQGTRFSLGQLPAR